MDQKTMWLQLKEVAYYLLPDDNGEGRLLAQTDDLGILRKLYSTLNRLSVSFKGYHNYRIENVAGTPPFNHYFPYCASRAKDGQILIGLTNMSAEDLLPVALLDYEKMEIDVRHERWILEQLLGLMTFSQRCHFALPFRSETFGISFAQERIVAIDWSQAKYYTGDVPLEVVRQEMLNLCDMLQSMIRPYLNGEIGIVRDCLRRIVSGCFVEPLEAYLHLVQHSS